MAPRLKKQKYYSMQLSVLRHDCLTPSSNAKLIHSLTLGATDKTTEKLDYEPGDWVTVQPQNKPELVELILGELSLQGSEEIELRRFGTVSVKNALTSHLEITQLNPAILNKLQRQMQFGNWSGRQEMIDFAYGKDILDLLDYFPQLKTMGVEFLSLLSPLAPRYYSIASANLKQTQLSILYRQVCYEHNGRQRFGVASNFLCDLAVNDQVEVEIKNNPTFKLPTDTRKPIVMIAAGTGIAPFVGFMQQRAFQFEQGEKLGKALMFFGETTRKEHCLFCEEFEAWQQQGLVENYCAFSREQDEKVYVQHKLQEQAKALWSLLQQGAYFYVCGSQARLAVAVKATMLTIFQQKGGLTEEAASDYWDELRKQKRLQQDVY